MVGCDKENKGKTTDDAEWKEEKTRQSVRPFLNNIDLHGTHSTPTTSAWFRHWRPNGREIPKLILAPPRPDLSWPVMSRWFVWLDSSDAYLWGVK